MSGERLDIEPFQSGAITFAGVKQAGLVYRVSPIERRAVIAIGNLNVDSPREIDLSTQLEHDLLVTGISADILSDDAQILQLDRKNNYNITYVQIVLETLNRNTKNVSKTTGLFLSGSTPLSTELILSPKAIYRFRSNLDVRSITITGKPVYNDNPLFFDTSITSSPNG